MAPFVEVHDIIAMEEVAERTGSFNKAMACWQVPFYDQRPFWYDIYNGFTSIYYIICYQHFLRNLPAPAYTTTYFETLTYLRTWAGLPPLQVMFDVRPRRPANLKSMAKRTSDGLERLHIRSSTPPPPLPEAYYAIALSADEEELTYPLSQSKLSQEQLTELQRSTHFDRKELQQWYKGMSPMTNIGLCLTILRLPQGLPIRHAHERRVSKDLQAILPLRRPFVIRRLCLQRVRQ